MKKQFFTLFAFLAMLTCSFAQTTVNITTCVDARVDSYQPSTNYSSSDELDAFAWTNGGNVYSRFFIKFDLSSIPSDANIISAKIFLYRDPTPMYAVPWSQGGNNQMLVQQVTQSWDVSTLTWNNKPSTTSTEQVTVPRAETPYQNCEIDVTLLFEQIHNSGNNYGFNFQLENETPHATYCFASSEHSNTALRPKLVVTYAPRHQIVLNESMIYSNCVCDDADPYSHLVDEQNSSTPSSTFSPTQTRTMYNKAQLIFNLKDSFVLDTMFFYDPGQKYWRGSDSIYIYTGNPSSWILKFGILIRPGINPQPKWDTIPFGDTSQFFMLEFNVPDDPAPKWSSSINEVTLRGRRYKINDITYASPVTHTAPPIDKIMGACGGGWDAQYPEILSCVSSVRAYHNWNWSDGGMASAAPWGFPQCSYYPSYDSNYYDFSPDWQMKHHDDDYNTITNSGIEIDACLQTSAYYFMNSTESKENIKPLFEGTNSNDPASYKAHADYLFQYTARYGSNPVPDSLLKLDNNTTHCDNQDRNQPRLSGLGYVTYVENWNEPDKFWSPWNDSTVQFTPFQMAAMSSADYDGHEQKLGNTFGVKNADPNIKMVMGGISFLNLDYIKSMKLWSEYNRTDKKFPADVLNFHHYSNNGTGTFQRAATIGISPEQDSLKLKLKEIVKYRNANLPDMEIWLSEFGYDTHPSSPQRVPEVGPYSQLEMQGRWLMRSFLEISASGIDRAHLFNIQDDGTGDSTQYYTSGLVTDNNNRLKKPSWYYIHALKNTLKGFYFSKEIPSMNSDINLYEFKNLNDDSVIYAVWCNTSDNTVVHSYKINLGSDACSANLIMPLHDSATYVSSGFCYSSSSLSILSDSVELDSVSELVVFVRKVRSKYIDSSLFTFHFTDTAVCKGTDVLTAIMDTPVYTSCRYIWNVQRTDTNVITNGAYSKSSNSYYYTYDSAGQVPSNFNFPGFYFKPGATYKVTLTAKTCGTTCETFVHSKFITVPLSVSIKASKPVTYNEVLQTGNGVITELKSTITGADNFQWTPTDHLSYPPTDSSNQLVEYSFSTDSITYFLIVNGGSCADTASITIRHNRFTSTQWNDRTVCLNNNTVVLGNNYDVSLLTGVLYYISQNLPNQNDDVNHQFDYLYMNGYYNSNPPFFDQLSGYMLKGAAKNIMTSSPALQFFVDNTLDKNYFYQCSWYESFFNEFYYGDRGIAINQFINKVDSNSYLQNLLSPGTLGYTWDDADISSIQNFFNHYSDDYLLGDEKYRLESSWEGYTQANGWATLPNNYVGEWSNYFLINDAPIVNTKYRFTVIDNSTYPIRVEYDETNVFVDTLLVIPYYLPYLQEDSTVYFINLSEPYNSTTTFAWRIYGNGTFSTEPDPVYTFPEYNKTYYVCLSLWNTCMPNGAAWCDSVRVDSNGLSSNFMATPIPPNKKETRFNTRISQEMFNRIATNGMTAEIKENIMTGNSVKKIPDLPWLEARPNPFSNYTNIDYDIKEKEGVQNSVISLSLINSLGVRLRNIRLSSPSGTVRLESAGLATGMYYCQLIVNGATVANKIVVID